MYFYYFDLTVAEIFICIFLFYRANSSGSTSTRAASCPGLTWKFIFWRNPESPFKLPTSVASTSSTTSCLTRSRTSNVCTVHPPWLMGFVFGSKKNVKLFFTLLHFWANRTSNESRSIVAESWWSCRLQSFRIQAFESKKIVHFLNVLFTGCLLHSFCVDFWFWKNENKSPLIWKHLRTFSINKS